MTQYAEVVVKVDGVECRYLGYGESPVKAVEVAVSEYKRAHGAAKWLDRDKAADAILALFPDLAALQAENARRLGEAASNLLTACAFIDSIIPFLRVKEQDDARRLLWGDATAFASGATRPYKFTVGLVSPEPRDAEQNAERDGLRADLAALRSEHDVQMERVKACEHIAEGMEGWEALRNECPSAVAVANLRDAFAALREENAQLKTVGSLVERRLREERDTLRAQLAHAERVIAEYGRVVEQIEGLLRRGLQSGDIPELDEIVTEAMLIHAPPERGATGQTDGA